MTRPKQKKQPPTPTDTTDSPLTPHEERHLRRMLFRRVEQLSKVAEAKGYGPAFTFTKKEMRFKS